jgi:hypothetical protein
MSNFDDEFDGDDGLDDTVCENDDNILMGWITYDTLSGSDDFSDDEAGDDEGDDMDEWGEDDFSSE